MPMLAQIASTGICFSWFTRMTLGAIASFNEFATVSSDEPVVSILTSLVLPASIYYSAYEVI